jgi:hypothetical protein
MKTRHFPGNELAVPVGDAGPMRWLLADERWRPWALRAGDFIARGGAGGGEEILKQGANRLIFRMCAPSAETAGESVVVKAFPMSTLKNRLYRHRRYGRAEAANLLEAARRDLPVPKVLGYGTIRRWGLTYCTAVMMEDVRPRVIMRQLLQDAKSRPREQERILEVCRDILLKVYRAGCNNVDFNCQTVCLLPDLSGSPRLIDFQYVRFLPQPSARVLMFQAAYFGNACLRYTPPDIIDRWFERLLESIDADDPAYWRAVYEGFKPVSLSTSTSQRLALR